MSIIPKHPIHRKALVITRRTRIGLILAAVGASAFTTLGSSRVAFSQVEGLGIPTSSTPDTGGGAVVVLGGTRLRTSGSCSTGLFELDLARGRCTHGPDMGPDLAHDIGSPPDPDRR